MPRVRTASLLITLAASAAGVTGNTPPRLIYPNVLLERAGGSIAGLPTLLTSPGDLDGDGFAELMELYPEGEEIRIRSSRNCGSWSVAVPGYGFSGDMTLRDAARADLDSDGTHELICWGEYTGGGQGDIILSVLKADGSGGMYQQERVVFRAKLANAPRERTDTIEIGDVTGDGLADVVLATPQVFIIPGLGGGDLGIPETARGVLAASLELADLDGDGTPEIVTGATDRSSVEIVRRFDGYFAWDGLLDVVFLNSRHEVPLLRSALLASGERVILAGTITSPLLNVSAIHLRPDGSLEQGAQLQHQVFAGNFLAADVAGGAATDLVFSSGEVIVDPGDDLVGEPIIVAAPLHEQGQSVNAVDALDADGDGDTDLFFSNGQGIIPAISLAAEGGAVPFDSLRTLEGGVASLNSTTNTIGATAADFDHDGIDELVLASSGGHDLQLFELNGDGLLTSRTVGTARSARPVAADIDGDGNPDLLAPGSNTSGFTILYGDGTGAFPDQQHIATPSPIYGLATGDTNRDGLAEIIVSGNGSFAVLYTQTTPREFSGIELHETGSSLGAAMGDLNGDGLDDALYSEPDGLAIFVADGAGGLIHATSIETGINPETVALLDLDGDGDLDAAQAGRSGVEIALLTNPGDGMLELAAPVLLFDESFREDDWIEFLAATDVDGDGRTDLVALTNTGLLRVLINESGSDSDSMLAPGPIIASSSSGKNTLAIGDLNGDGAADLGTGTFTPGGGFGGGTPMFRAEIYLSNASALCDCPADLDQNGILDLADIVAFAGAFQTSDPLADLAPPYNTLDLADLVAFIEAFLGCR